MSKSNDSATLDLFVFMIMLFPCYSSVVHGLKNGHMHGYISKRFVSIRAYKQIAIACNTILYGDCHIEA